MSTANPTATTDVSGRTKRPEVIANVAKSSSLARTTTPTTTIRTEITAPLIATKLSAKSLTAASVAIDGEKATLTKEQQQPRQLQQQSQSAATNYRTNNQISPLATICEEDAGVRSPVAKSSASSRKVKKFSGKAYATPRISGLIVLPPTELIGSKSPKAISNLQKKPKLNSKLPAGAKKLCNTDISKINTAIPLPQVVAAAVKKITFEATTKHQALIENIEKARQNSKPNASGDAPQPQRARSRSAAREIIAERSLIPIRRYSPIATKSVSFCCHPTLNIYTHNSDSSVSFAAGGMENEEKADNNRNDQNDDAPGSSSNSAAKKRKINEENSAKTSSEAAAAAGPSTSTQPAEEDKDKEEDKDAKKKKNRCAECRKKVGLTGFQCRCGGLYCAVHRYSDKHDCTFNYREHGAQEIRRNNPVVVGEKIQKI